MKKDYTIDDEQYIKLRHLVVAVNSKLISLNGFTEKFEELKEVILDFIEKAPPVQPRTVSSYNYTAKDLAEIFVGLDPVELERLAKDGFTPCMIEKESGVPYFKKTEIASWIKENMFDYSSGKAIPRIDINLFVTPETPSDGNGVPIELSGIRNLMMCNAYLLPPCVYFLVKDSRVQYVGQSTNLYARITQHRKEKNFEKVYYMVVPYNSLNETETKFIKALKPPLNLQATGSCNNRRNADKSGEQEAVPEELAGDPQGNPD